jgi:hypothetical protein
MMRRTISGHLSTGEPMTAIRMMFSSQGKALLILSLFAVTVSAGVIPLTIDTGAAVSNFPLSTGIPFPRGALTSLDNLKLVNAALAEIPAQFSALCKWPDNSIKSVLVHFFSDISPTAKSGYSLNYGPGVTRQTYQTGLGYTDDDASITVTTGPVKFRVNKTGFDLFNRVYIDNNDNGIFEETEKIVNQGASLFFNNAVDNQVYTSSLYPNPVCTVEEAGPVRLVLKITGKLRSPSGQDLTDFKVWMYAYAGKEQVTVEYTLVDSREDPDVEHPPAVFPVCAKAYGIYMPYAIPNAAFTFGGENNQRYTGANTGTHFIYQHGSLNFINGSMEPFTLAYEGAGTGVKAPGWMDVSSAACGIGVAVRNFWQQFPKEFSVNDSSLTVYLHPELATSPTPDVSYPALNGTAYIRPNTFYFPQYGGAKTYQMLFSFHTGTASAGNILSLNQAFQRTYPQVSAPATWYTDSKVFGDMLTAGPWSAGFDAFIKDDIYSTSTVNRDQSLLFIYGWRDYGDRMRGGWCDVSSAGTRIAGFYNDTHVGATNFFHQYLRTMDKSWFELAEIATRHFMDIDVAHCNRKGYWSSAYGNLGPGEGHLSKHEIPDHADRNIHFGHAHLSGLADYYLLTGDKRAYEVMKEMGDWWANMAPFAFKTPIDSPHFAEAERDYAWPLFTMNEAFRGTGDTKYLQAAAQEVKHLLGWWKTPSHHYVNGAIVGENNCTAGTGWWYMYPRCDNSPAPTQNSDGSYTILYNGTNPWMAGPLFSSLIQFRGYNADYGLVNEEDIKEMLLQTVNYVVKYGWNESKQSLSYNYFNYCEAAPGTDGGSNHLVYPLASMWQEFNAGGLAHPAWYDMAAKWRTIATDAYNDWKIVKSRGSTTSGFYGYEIIYPLDYFSLMAKMIDNGTVAFKPQVKQAARLLQPRNGFLFEGLGSREGMAKMLICNARGQIVAALTTPEHAGAPLRLQWSSIHVPRGIYVATISAGPAHSAKSIIISR